MEISVIENTKNRLRLEVKGEGHSFCNIIKSELWNQKNVEIAGYHIEHSFVSEPVIVVQSEKGDTKKIILDAVEDLRKKNKSLREAFKKI